MHLVAVLPNQIDSACAHSPFDCRRVALSPFSLASSSRSAAMSVIGIDLGTQNAVIAQALRGGVDVILNESSKRLTP